MRREQLVSDNPYRLLCVGSSLDYAGLRRRADSVSRAVQAGLPHDVPLTDAFGSEGLGDIVSAVRGLGGDTLRRTIFRIMWPIDERAIPYLSQGGQIPRGLLSKEAQRQILFLGSWYTFVAERTLEDLKNVYKDWIDLWSEDAFRSRLTEFVQAEDGSAPEIAARLVDEAKEFVQVHLLHRAIEFAADLWNGDDFDGSIAIVRAVLESPLPDEQEERALQPVVAIGDSLAASIQAAADGIQSYEPAKASKSPPEIAKLNRLIAVIDKRHPVTRTWKEARDSWSIAVALSMRDRAIALANNEQKYSEALLLIEAAFSLTNDARTLELLVEDKKTLHDLMYGGVTPPPQSSSRRASASTSSSTPRPPPVASDEIKPISSAPSMGTLNGIGVMLYETGTYKPDPRYKYAILFFTFFFIPVFPMSRYLVERVTGNSWRFLGGTAWTKGMKLHLFSSLALIVGCFIAGLTSGSGSSSQYTDTSAPWSSSSTATPYSPPPSSDHVTHLTEAEIQHLDKLQKEQHQLQNDIDAESDEQSKRKFKLDGDFSELEGTRKEIDGERASAVRHGRISSFNAKVDGYNRWLRSYRKEAKAYNEEREHLIRMQKRLDEVTAAVESMQTK